MNGFFIIHYSTREYDVLTPQRTVFVLHSLDVERHLFPSLLPLVAEGSTDTKTWLICDPGDVWSQRPRYGQVETWRGFLRATTVTYVSRHESVVLSSKRHWRLRCSSNRLEGLLGKPRNLQATKYGRRRSDVFPTWTQFLSGSVSTYWKPFERYLYLLNRHPYIVLKCFRIYSASSLQETSSKF